MNDLEVLVLNQGFNKLAGLSQWGEAVGNLMAKNRANLSSMNLAAKAKGFQRIPEQSALRTYKAQTKATEAAKNLLRQRRARTLGP